MEPPLKKAKMTNETVVAAMLFPVCSQEKPKKNPKRGSKTIAKVLETILKKVEGRHLKVRRAWQRLSEKIIKKERSRRRLWRNLLSKWRITKKKVERERLQTERANQHPLEHRKFDTAKHVELHYISKHLEPFNVPFDEEAQAKKREIFGACWKTRCVWSGDDLSKGLSVDHIFPVRNAYGNKKDLKTGWHDGGLRGGNSEWNTVMVRKELNSGFKIFDHQKTHGWKKNIGWQVLTSEEESQCTPAQKCLYDKIKSWRAYCDSRGARYCWKFNRQMNLDLAAAYEAVYEDIIRREQAMIQHVPAILKNIGRLVYPTI